MDYLKVDLGNHAGFGLVDNAMATGGMNTLLCARNQGDRYYSKVCLR